MSARTPKPTWLVRGGVAGTMYLRSLRGVGGEPRWAIKATDARRFTTREEADVAAGWSGGRVEGGDAPARAQEGRR